MTTEKQNIEVSPRFIATVAAAFIGLGSVGGGVSILNSPADEVRELANQVNRLSDRVENLHEWQRDERADDKRFRRDEWPRLLMRMNNVEHRLDAIEGTR